ncbi:MAG TPA: immunoglobulin domain-containing protein [Candidatus Polarisedimenticolaceae bacterium]|nr:immunoglobulin domain-containing protein [Candidatus Polarisedimenticolaceae bacterium]
MRAYRVALFAIAGAATTVSARELSLADRIAAQRAIEQVYQNHRIWPAENAGAKPPVTDEVVRARVEDYLLKSNALETRLHRPITPADLQAELDRMASHTRDPQLLQELFDALGDDPQLIAETLVRETLASRLILPSREGLRPEVADQRGTYALPVIEALSSVSAVPSARSGQTAIWTGASMIVWGGEPATNTGGIYDPATDWWMPLSTGAGVPDPRSRHSAVWTGSEMIVWGGLTGSGEVNTGGRYSPATDSWTAISTGANCPSARQWHTAVWTGSTMIVWGGLAGSTYLNTGGVYDPTSDTWTATGTGAGVASIRARHTAVWSGTQMVVWGGTDSVGRLNTGSRYTPGTDSWSATSLTGVPAARYRHSVIWTGTQMIVWGGFGTTYLNTGGRYNPAINGWSSTAGGPSARADHTAVWSGSEMIIWGGQTAIGNMDSGARYNTGANTWTLVPSGGGSPAARYGHSAVWTGSEMIVWGGTTGVTALDTGGVYFASTWTPTAGSAPTIRFQPGAWAGILGGSASFSVGAGGNSPLTYQWRKDGNPLTDGPRVGGSAGDTLTVTGLTAADAGAYSVTVTNAISSVLSNDAALTVATPRGGDPDPSFFRGTAAFTGGLVTIDAIESVAAQSDGKTLIAGAFSSFAGGPRGRIARLNADGSLDRTFMNGMAGANGTIWAMLVQPDGKILIGGDFTMVDGVARTRIARLNADGSLDATFQNGMKGASDTVYSMALQPDGRVVIGGAFTLVNDDVQFSQQHYRLARLNADGSTDGTFQGAIDQSCGAGCPGAYAIAVQPDGKLIVGGRFSEVNGQNRLGLARLNADGSTDATFLNGMSGPDYIVYSVALQTDGRILIGGGFGQVNGVDRPYLARLLPDGSLDATFLSGMSGPDTDAKSIVVQPDGRILIAGFFGQVNGVSRVNVARLLADGSVDTTFQEGMSGAGGGVGARSLSLRRDGKVVIGGPDTVNGVAFENVALLNADGSLDPYFAPPAASMKGAVRALAVQPDGRAIVGGLLQTVDGVPRGRIARLDVDGNLDKTFANGMTGAVEFAASIEAAALQADGKIVVGGYFASMNGVPRYGIARLNADGSVDTTFQNGMSGTDYAVYAVALQPDGKILIGGAFTLVNGEARGRVARLNADGSLDESFVDPMVGPGSLGSVWDLVLMSDGRVVIGGSFERVENANTKYVARLNPDGHRDITFLISIPNFQRSFSDLAVQPDGRIVVVGRNSADSGMGDDIEQVFRLTTSGTLDAGFQKSTLGWTDSQFYGYARRAYSIVLQPDGKIVIGGQFPVWNNSTPRGNIVRLNGDGSLDTSFADTMPGVNGKVDAMAVLPDGRLLLGGDFGDVNHALSGNVARVYGSAPVAPGIATPPSDQNSYEGSCAVFHVSATGTPLNYQWRKNGVPIAGAQAATLMLTGVSAADVGDYDCLVTNVLGTATSFSAHLNVSPVPACKIASCDPVLGSVLSDVPAPAEVASVRIDVTSTLSWTDLGGGTAYDVASSTISDLRSGGIAGATCLANDVSGASYADGRIPAAGEAYYYIVRGQTACGTGGYGTDSNGVPRSPAAACP